LNAVDRPAQHKALVTPFTDLFDGSPTNTLQYIASFTTRCVETGVIGDFEFTAQENPPPSNIDLTDPIQAASWKNDPRHLTKDTKKTKGNLLIDSSTATVEKLQAARDHI
jgi:hypothetical protein